ncbi:MAG: hypothetical protein H7333_08295 [Bdellovibrionales bacterium]|nr:hypothetical protein [Oligoflexia bacterium]
MNRFILLLPVFIALTACGGSNHGEGFASMPEGNQPSAQTDLEDPLMRLDHLSVEEGSMTFNKLMLRMAPFIKEGESEHEFTRRIAKRYNISCGPGCILKVK